MKRSVVITSATVAVAVAVVVGVIIAGQGSASGTVRYTPAKHVHAAAVRYHAIVLRWNAPSWAKGFGIWKNGVHVAKAGRRTYTFRNLSCDTSYRLGVRVLYAGGHRSRTTWVTVRTLHSCPANVFIASGGSDSGPCTAAQPCQTFQRAYDAAKPGQIVEVAGGSYPSQTLDPTGKPSGASPVLFRRAPAALVSVGEVRTDGVGGLEFRGMAIDDYYLGEGSSRITFRNDSAHTFYIRSSHHISIIGGSVGGNCDAESATVGAAYQSKVRSTSILIDGVRFHDITRDCSPGSHVECLFVQETTGITIENSSFTNCNIFDIYFHRIGLTDDPHNVVVRNNVLDPATDGGYYSMLFRADSGESLANYLIKANTVRQNMLIENSAGSSVTNFRLCKNKGSGTLKVLNPTSGVRRGAC